MFKCALHDTYNYTLNILSAFGAFSCHSKKHRGKPLLFYDKCPGFFYVYYTTHGTYSFTSHPKDEAIMVKCLAQGHKCHDRDVQTVTPAQPDRNFSSHFSGFRVMVEKNP